MFILNNIMAKFIALIVIYYYTRWYFLNYIKYNKIIEIHSAYYFEIIYYVLFIIYQI